MDSRTIAQVIDKLIGPTEPVGETNQDIERKRNTETLVVVVDTLFSDIVRLAKNANRAEHSVSKCGKVAEGFLLDLADDVGDWRPR